MAFVHFAVKQPTAYRKPNKEIKQDKLQLTVFTVIKILVNYKFPLIEALGLLSKQQFVNDSFLYNSDLKELKMQNFIILLMCIGFVQGCTNNQTLTNDDIRQSIIDEFKSNKNEAGQPIELGGTCSYRGSSNSSSNKCSLKSMQLAGMPCTCTTINGVHNGSVTR
jgi:hypothetical protein